jgi:hypothetical protein
VLVAIAAAIVVGTGLGCASLLGGLEDGTAPPVARLDAADGVESGEDGAQRDGCISWLGSFRYRVPLLVHLTGPAVGGYQVNVRVPTSSLVAAGKLRADGADLRVTTADGVSTVPHWLESGVGSDSTSLWTKLDLDQGETTAWLYYGSADAPDVSSMTKTFVSGVLDDPTFDRRDAWDAFHDGIDTVLPSSTNAWSVALAHDAATIRIVREATPHSARAGICQSVLFPSGSSFHLVFGVNVTIADHGNAAVTLGGLNGDVIWRIPPNEIGVHSNVESGAIAPGTETLCLVAYAFDSDVGQGAEATYSGLRVRRYVTPEPHVDAVGTEQEGCR